MLIKKSSQVFFHVIKINQCNFPGVIPGELPASASSDEAALTRGGVLTQRGRQRVWITSSQYAATNHQD